MFIGHEEITDPDVDLDKVRRWIGMVFQSFNLFPHLSVLQNLTVAQIQVLSGNKAEAEKIARAEPRAGRHGAQGRRRTRRSCRVVSSSASPSPGRCR